MQHLAPYNTDYRTQTANSLDIRLLLAYSRWFEEMFFYGATTN